VLTAIIFKSRHRVAGVVVALFAAFLVLSFAPPAWMDRMGQFAQGHLDSSAEERLISWGTSWNLAHDYPLTGGSFDVLPNVNVFQRYQPRPLPMGFLSSAPHSIYFQLLADHGFPGLFLFLLIIASCFWSLWRIRRTARRYPSVSYLVNYSHMVEVAILGFMISGAFLGFVYLDVIYQMIGLVAVLKMLCHDELSATAIVSSHDQDETAAQPIGELALVR
jgi:probable O-glycosylation ligase (exosortase A-associated)